MTDLKPCPFCGSRSVEHWVLSGVRCGYCGSCSPSAIRWNAAPRLPSPALAGEAVRVRIAVAVDEGGRWATDGWGRRDGMGHPDVSHEHGALDNLAFHEPDMRAHVVWVTADVPLPPKETIQGEVEA